MPNFTEGEWKSEEGFIWAHKDGMVKMVADFIPFEADARLMAQSKKMYEALRGLFNDDGEMLYKTPADKKEWADQVRAVLSEIDKE